MITQGGDAAPAKLVLVNLAQATDVKNFALAASVPLVLEDVNADFVALGITPASTKVVLDLGAEFPEITDRKLEGLTILDDDEIAISNDNDFGIGAVPNATSKVYTIRLGEKLR